jgi:RNA polymerase sigma-70 factor, ECF subfamily
MNGDTEALLALLAEDVTLYSDGGGKVKAALNPLQGRNNVVRFLFGIIGKAPPGLFVRRATVNGRPGLVGYFEDGRPQSVVSLDVAEGRIRAVRIVVNPDKLRALPPLS